MIDRFLAWLGLDSSESSEKASLLEIFHQIETDSNNSDWDWDWGNPEARLSNEDYILYKTWLAHKRTEKPLIFHGACHDCTSQKNHGLFRCEGCLYFRFNLSLPDLRTKDSF